MEINNEKDKEITKMKYKFLKMSKRNILKIITCCFWGYLTLSLILTLREVFLSPDWSQIIMQYSKAEIIIECIFFIITRCYFTKCTDYFNIFRS